MIVALGEYDLDISGLGNALCLCGVVRQQCHECTNTDTKTTSHCLFDVSIATAQPGTLQQIRLKMEVIPIITAM